MSAMEHFIVQARAFISRRTFSSSDRGFFFLLPTFPFFSPLHAYARDIATRATSFSPFSSSPMLLFFFFFFFLLLFFFLFFFSFLPLDDVRRPRSRESPDGAIRANHRYISIDHCPIHENLYFCTRRKSPAVHYDASRHVDCILLHFYGIRVRTMIRGYSNDEQNGKYYRLMYV